MTLAGEDANPNLVDVGTVADEEIVGTSLSQIWKMKLGHTACLKAEEVKKNPLGCDKANELA